MNGSSTYSDHASSLLDIRLPFAHLPFHFTKTTALFPLLLLYPIVQRSLRYQRERSMLRKYGYDGLSRRERRQKLRTMTLDEAGEIQRYMLELEFPNAFLSSLTYGFIQTLAFPESSALLHSTNEISSADNSPKRFTDTALLVENFISFPPTSPRARAAISRMNYLHGVYGKKITNEQLLYVLGVFASNPWEWVRTWEWREMNDMETGALAVFWKGIGEMMGIDMSEMKGMAKGHPDYSTSWDDPHDGKEVNAASQEWNDPIDWMLDMRAYIEHHDELSLDHSPAVEALVKQTLESALILVPKKWQDWAVDLLFVRFESKYMKAIRAREPSTRTRNIGMGIAKYKRLFLKHVALPRPSFMSARKVDERGDPSTGRYFAKVWAAYPQYVKPTMWNLWGPGVWVSRLLGGPLPGDRGDWYQPEGYKIDEIGPRRYIGKGHEWMEKDLKKGEEVMPAGKCPFGG